MQSFFFSIGCQIRFLTPHSDGTCSHDSHLESRLHKMCFRQLCQMFEGIEGIEIVVDDLLIWGETEEQHDSRQESYKEQSIAI